MDGSGTTIRVPAELRPSVAQLVAGLLSGTSAVVTGLDGTAVVLRAAAAILFLSRTRVLQVRPPLDLNGFMDQVVQAGTAAGDTRLEQGFNALTTLDPSCDRIVLLVDDAHLMQDPALRYIELALHAGPQLCVVLAGRPEGKGTLALPGFAALDKRLSLRLELPALDAALPADAPVVPMQPVRMQPSQGRRPRVWRHLAGAALAAGVAVAMFPSSVRLVPRATMADSVHPGRELPAPAPVGPAPPAAAQVTAAALPASGDPAPSSPPPGPAGGQALVAPEPPLAANEAPATPPVTPSMIPEAAPAPLPAGHADVPEPSFFSLVAATEPPAAPSTPPSVQGDAAAASPPTSSDGPALAADLPQAPEAAPPPSDVRAARSDASPELPPPSAATPAAPVPLATAEAVPPPQALPDQAAAAEPSAPSPVAPAPLATAEAVPPPKALPDQAAAAEPSAPSPIAPAPLATAEAVPPLQALPDQAAAEPQAPPQHRVTTLAIPAAVHPVPPSLRPQRRPPLAHADPAAAPAASSPDLPRCRAIVMRAQLGEDLTHDDQTFMRRGCR